ncbi:hypothetical protein [Marinomonas aquiplantarum]|uniref:Uncharacterized protein n=1 Tax=Marinomonas aquiplantarum TaxID=491951 RepID=A0A366CVT9_9GAMM|nr:hypothetical protein [Marinomonas aquiplantarum]RBO80208.1 hypothetical protein DFP76_10871 [Marinomonas aquiplantarum]
MMSENKSNQYKTTRIKVNEIGVYGQYLTLGLTLGANRDYEITSTGFVQISAGVANYGFVSTY